MGPAKSSGAVKARGEGRASLGFALALTVVLGFFLTGVTKEGGTARGRVEEVELEGIVAGEEEEVERVRLLGERARGVIVDMVMREDRERARSIEGKSRASGR